MVFLNNISARDIYRSPGPLPSGPSVSYRSWPATASQDASESLAAPSEPPADQGIVIAVMGVTGAGKSTFVKMVSGRDDVIVGESLSSETSEVRAYQFFHNHKNYILVDTPGFDDSRRNDSEITKQILTWLKESLLEGTRLNGIIYLHRITDTRMGGTAHRNNRMFRKLCGVGAFKNVILATTFWEHVTLADGNRREKELCENPNFWGGMLNNGAKIARLQHNRRSGLELLEQISGNEKVILNVQDEMVYQGRAVGDTSAARQQKELAEQFQRELEAEMKAEKERLESELRVADEERRVQLWREREYLRWQRETQKIAEERRQARERREAEERHQWQLWVAEEELVRAEMARQMEKDDMERRERQEMERLRAREWAAEAERALQWRRYVEQYACIGCKPRWPCNRCGGGLKRGRCYYHCCFCNQDAYFQCEYCGPRCCGDSSHPLMQPRPSSDDECIIM